MRVSSSSPFIRWISPTLWGLVIFILSLMPGGKGNMMLFGIPHFDKVGHFGMYAIWTFLFFIALKGSPGLTGKGSFWIALLVGALTGAVLEFGQYFMAQGRSFELADMIANAIGAAAGAGTGLFIFRTYSRQV